MFRLIREYRATLRAVEKARQRATDEQDKANLGYAASDLRYSIEYMTTGRRPGNRRGASRLSAEQREIPFDPMDSFFIKSAALGRVREKDLSPERKAMLDDFLALLTEKEKEAFCWVRGSRCTFEYTAKLMGISKASVQKYVYRAERKVFLAAGRARDVIQMPPNSERENSDLVLKKPSEGYLQRSMFCDYSSISK